MVDPITGIGLASSILTLAEAGYKISKRTIEFSRLLGELPPYLQECSNLMDVLVRTGKRLQAQLEAEGPGIGPITAMHADLESLFNQCNQTASVLLSFLDRLQKFSSLSKAIQLTRKEGEILKIRNKLDQHILAILFILEEHQQMFNEDLRNIVKDLRADFYQFHRKLVEQMSQGFSRVETAINHSKESLLRDVKPLVAAAGEAAHMSNLRLLAGQQDLSQNLHRMEQNFASVLEDGEAGLAIRFRQQLTEHHAATRTLFQSVYNRQNDDMRAQMQLLYQEVTKALGEFDAAQKISDVKIPNNHLRIKATFEFDIRSHFIALHISQGMEWVSSTIFLPAVRPSTWLAISVPIPRFDHRPKRYNALDMAVRSAPVNFLIQQGTDQYHLIKIDLSKQQYDQDIGKALDKVYSDYRGNWWRTVSLTRILRIRYVKYGSYSKTMQCFTAIEGSNPENDDGHPFTNLPSMLLHSLKERHAFKYNRAYAPSMHEGYALFIEEEQYVTGSTTIITCFIITAIRALYYRSLELDGVPFVLDAVTWNLALWSSCFFVPLRFRLKSVLLIAMARILILILWYNYHDGNTKLVRNGSTFVLVALISSVLVTTVSWLLVKYSIKFDWKEVRSLFW